MLLLLLTLAKKYLLFLFLKLFKLSLHGLRLSLRIFLLHGVGHHGASDSTKGAPKLCPIESLSQLELFTNQS